MKTSKVFLVVSIISVAGISHAQPAGTPPRFDLVAPMIPPLPVWAFEFTPRIQVAEFAELEAELALASTRIAFFPPMSLLEPPLAPGVLAEPSAFLSDVAWDGESSQQDPGYRTYKDGYNLILQEKLADARNKLAEVVRKYPSSRYVDDAQYWTAFSWMQSQPGKAAQLYRDFLRTYPTSNYFDDAVADLGRLEGQAAADSALAARAAYQSRAAASAPRGTMPVTPPLYGTAPVVAATPLPPSSPRAKERDPELQLKLNVIDAMRRNPDERSFKTLQEIALDSSQPREMRKAAIYALRDFDRSKVLEMFLSLAKNDPDVKIQQEALHNIGRHAGQNDERAFAVLKEFALDSKQPRDVRETAIYALKNTKYEDVLSVYLQIAKNDKDRKIQQSALYYIGQLGRGSDDKAFQVLKNYAQDRNQERELRETALYALREWKSGDVLAVYLDVVKNDPDKRIRQTALYYVGQLARSDDQKAYQVLKQYALDRKQEQEFRETALNSLREMRSSDVLNLLIEIVRNDPDEKIRQIAIYQLGQLRKDFGPEVGKLLKELALDRNQPREIRRSAIYAVREFSDIDVYALFVDLAMNDTDKDIQQMAIYYIGHNSKDKSKSLNLLIQLFDKLPAERTQSLESCLYGIASVGDERAVDFLIKVAKTHENYDLRQKAVYYLGNIGGEKARAALVEILKGK